MKLSRAIISSAAVVPFLLLLGGCQYFNGDLAGARLWAAPEPAMLWADSEPELENEIYSEAGRIIHLSSAINEIISFQVGVRASGAGLRIHDVAISELRQGAHIIPPEQTRLYRELRMEVADYPAWFLRLTPQLRARREYPDVLVPLYAPKGGLPIEVRPNQTEALWVDIDVPPGTTPGIYSGQLRIAGATGGVRTVNLELEVWPFALPQTRHLNLVAGLNATELLRQHVEVGGQPYAPSRISFEDPASKQAVPVIDQTLRLLHEHRLSPVLTDVVPLTRLTSDGRQDLDWTDYDRLIAGVLEGTLFEDRLAATAWPMPVNEKSPPPEAYGGWGSPAHREALAEYMRQSVAHFRDKGWFDRHYIWMPLPGATRGQQYQQFDWLGRVMREAGPRLNLVCGLTPQSMAPYGMANDPFRDVSALVGTWCPPAGLADPSELARLSAAGKTVWLWPDRPPFAGSLSMLAPPLHARSLAWQAYRFGCGGVFLPAVNAWPVDGSVSAQGSEAALIWPGKAYGLDRPAPSVRLKRLLRGLQDYEYLWLLEQNHRPGIARLIAADLFEYGGALCYGEHCLDGRPNGWVSDPAAWSLARRLMARELLAAFKENELAESQPAGSDDVIHFEQQIEWARLTEAVRGVRAEVEGVRVQFDGRDVNKPLRLDATVSLFNATREPFSGRLTFAGLPDGWNLDAAGVVIDKLEARRPARRVLSASVPAFNPNPDGVFQFQVGVGREGAPPALSPARVCAITSQRVGRQINIDGRLDDWPLGVNNVAGDFILVGALDVPKRGMASADRPSQSTLVFACHDREYLYFGFNCADDRLGERVVSRGNTVQYDELWPTGEDLIEVVLDPTHRAVDAGGLLHFVVKANGAVISEQGTPCLSSVARHSDWPAGVAAALDDTSQKDRWTVEIRIPLQALAAKPGIWGVNFGRFNARLGEYSSWSGARRYLYSPASLGNMRVDY